MTLEHNCGLAVTRTLHDAYNFVKSLQHRGRDATGIGAFGEKIDVLKWTGDVSTFDKIDLHRIFGGDYHTFIAHVRYATRGSKNSKALLRSAHPVTVGGEEIDRGNHIIIKNCDAILVHNGQVSDDNFNGINLSELKGDGDSERLLHLYLNEGIKKLVENILGAYTLAIADKKFKDVIAVRDRTGIKPGFLGYKDGSYLIASEDIAFKKNGAITVEEMPPGTVYYISPDGDYRKEEVVQPNQRSCFFEWNYIANALSNLRGINVKFLRTKLGIKLAEEFTLEKIDFVTFVPRCPEPAARSYATALRIPFRDIFYKRKAERAFQGPNAKERNGSIKDNLHLIPNIEKIIGGKRIVVIDDSTIRGNNSKHVKELLYGEAKVKEAYLLNYTPQVGIIGSDGIARGCEWGVDMPPQENENHRFIARNRNLEEISKEIGMPTKFISVKGMLDVFRSLGVQEDTLCTFCIGGKYPFKDLETHTLEA
jgi:amidophosphoribosyltransferase